MARMSPALCLLCVISLFGVRCTATGGKGLGLAPTVFSCYVFAHAFSHIGGVGGRFVRMLLF